MINWTESFEPEAPVTVTARSRGAFMDDIQSRLMDGQGFAVATLNLDHAVKLRKNPDFRAAYGKMSHVTADGNPIVWLEHLSGQTTELLTGSDMMEPILALAARLGVPIGFFGATKDTLSQARDVLMARHAGLDVRACLAPPMGFDPQSAAADAAIAEMAASGARVWVLALGAPKQEMLAARAFAAHPDMGFLCFGAGLDFVVGHQVRAPRWMRRLALEWVWRMMQDPGRLARRYGACAMILPALTHNALRARRRATQ